MTSIEDIHNNLENYLKTDGIDVRWQMNANSFITAITSIKT
jgi:hypothetical protein